MDKGVENRTTEQVESDVVSLFKSLIPLVYEKDGFEGILKFLRDTGSIHREGGAGVSNSDLSRRHAILFTESALRNLKSNLKLDS
ncbi:hypothetical protein [Burkholderia diffusa]|uniref:hypothetical protein n=1 Tax=Burkholderia diffusa TaxID=488732 RepID=UPI000ACB23F5|nr:hypothetical protein [Burkholderia diffusa]